MFSNISTPSTASPRLFIVHASEDAWFVHGFFLPAINFPRSSVVLSTELELGAMVVDEIVTAAHSAVTVVVMSPHFLSSPWARLASKLSLTHVIEDSQNNAPSLIPALLADCDLSLLERSRISLDFRHQDAEHWRAEIAKLQQHLVRRLPLPPLEAKPPMRPPCPYPGMRPFRSSEAASFHGREDELEELLRRLRYGARELYILGSSGTGKSSLVLAGLIPQLTANAARAGGSWLVKQMRPGAHPARTLKNLLEITSADQPQGSTRWLAATISRLLSASSVADEQRLLIFIDQLEEIFTLSTPSSRDAYFEVLAALRTDPRVALISTLRADFYGALMESPLWSAAKSASSRLDIGPLRGAELKRAIEAPARAAGVYFEPVLVERLLQEVANAPGALPLLQDTLLTLWHRPTGNLLRLEEYLEMGDHERSGLARIVALRADHALELLPPKHQPVAHRILLRLICFVDDNTSTRRPQSRADLRSAADSAHDLDHILQHLTDHRLLTISDGRGHENDDDHRAPSAKVELVHEILLTAWPKLTQWIASRRRDEERRRALEVRATEWIRSGRGQSRLLDAGELQDSADWLRGESRRDLGLSEDGRLLLERSQHKRHRNRLAVIGVICALVTAVAFSSLFAFFARERSREAEMQRSMHRRQLAASYLNQGHAHLLERHPAKAAPYLFAVRRLLEEDSKPIGRPLRAMFHWALRGIPLLRIPQPNDVLAVAWSPDGQSLAAANLDRSLNIWNIGATASHVLALRPPEIIRSVLWSPDGSILASVSTDHIATFWRLDANQTQRAAWPCFDSAELLLPEDLLPVTEPCTSYIRDPTHPILRLRNVAAIAWSPDGERLAFTSLDGSVQIWEIAAGVVRSSPMRHLQTITAIAWSLDGKSLATASNDHTSRIWDASTVAPLSPPLLHQGPVSAVAWSPDGSRIATASEEAAFLWVISPQIGPPLRLAHEDQVNALAWSPDGHRLLTSASDATVRSWDPVTGANGAPPLLHPGGVSGVAWSPDGGRAASGCSDAVLRIWQMTDPAPRLSLSSHQLAVTDIAWSPDGRTLATASKDATVRIWDTAGGRALLSLPHRGAANAVTWSPNGAFIATASADRTAQIWNAATGLPSSQPLVHQAEVIALAWSPDGNLLATVARDDIVRIWNPAGELLSSLIGHRDAIKALEWSPDGHLLATGSRDGTARIWNPEMATQVTAPLHHRDSVLAIAWNPNGLELATASLDFTAVIWAAASGAERLRIRQHQSAVTSVKWSPNGARFATCSLDTTALVFESRSGAPVAQPLQHHDSVLAMEWSSDGELLATTSWEGLIRIWDASTGILVSAPLSISRMARRVKWSPNGDRIATTNHENDVHIWDLVESHGSLADWKTNLERGDYFLNEREILTARARINEPHRTW